MNYIVSYDIADNKNRKKISDYLIERGFIRIQKSVFIGEISNDILKKITAHIKNSINEKTDNVCCIPIDKNSYDNIITFGNSVDYRIYEQDIMFL